MKKILSKIIIISSLLTTAADANYSFNFANMKLTAVARILSEASKENFTVCKSKKSVVIDVKLSNLSLNSIIKSISLIGGIKHYKDNGINYFCSDDEAEKFKKKKYQIIKINYLTKQFIDKFLKDQEYSFNEVNNLLITNNFDDNNKKLMNVLKTLDKQPKRIKINCKIVSVNRSFSKELGVRFGVNSKDKAINTLSDLATTAANNSFFAVTLAKELNSVLSLELSALENNDKGKVLSSPTLLIDDNQQASIKEGVQVAYQSSSANTGTNVQLFDAFLELTVKPKITNKENISIDLLITNNNPISNSASGSNIGGIANRSLQTKITVKNNEVIMLGGILSNSEDTINYSVPWLSDLKYVGWLFKSRSEKKSDREVLIFITASIII